MVLKFNWINTCGLQKPCSRLTLTKQTKANLEARYILVQVEKASDRDLDLVVGEVWEGGLQ